MSAPRPPPGAPRADKPAPAAPKRVEPPRSEPRAEARRPDAIAGLIITAINIVGGIAIGYIRHGMGMGEAADVFIKLSVGDGLVTQIPALIVSLAAALPLQRALGTTRLVRLGVLVVSLSMFLMAVAEFSVCIFVVALLLLGSATCLFPAVLLLLSTQVSIVRSNRASV